MRTYLLALILCTALSGCGHELVDGPGDSGPSYCIPAAEPSPAPSPSPSPSATPSPSPAPDDDDVSCTAYKAHGCVFVTCTGGTVFLLKGSKKHCGGA